MKPSLRVIAGPEAARRIRDRGFSLDLFDTFIGASGGPKWLTLYGLDRALAPRLAGREQRLQMIGSSIGALRLACYSQRNPAAAFDRFLESYLDVPPKRLTRASLQRFVEGTVEAVLEGGRAEQILDNTLQPIHIVTARCERIAASERFPQAAMIPAAILNAMNPAWLRLGGVHRAIFASDLGSPIACCGNYPGDRIALTARNLAPALLASGSIPGFLDGVCDIPGAPGGVYRDGGIVDYHFDPRWVDGEGLILYPHFGPALIPGWFDKPFPGRHLDPATLDRVVVLAPSADFVAALPHGKIPDRRDALRFEPAAMRRYWAAVASESERLGEVLLRLLDTGAPDFLHEWFGVGPEIA
jgi:hypothetical protein